MSRALHITLLSIATTLLTAYIVWAMWLVPDRRAEQLCEQIVVTVKDSISRQFITPSEVKGLLNDRSENPLGKTYKEINTHTIENLIEQHEVVEKAECYKLCDGTVRIVVEQRLPRLRVIGEQNYYVDSHRQIMQATSHTAYHVPVVTGRVSKRMATEELYDFACWIEAHDFWNAQIEQINVTPRMEIELIPRIGGHTILLGRLGNYEQQLERLKIFYSEGLSKIGWKDYAEIDLRFENQVIGRRR